jgi:hypothetical protein
MWPRWAPRRRPADVAGGGAAGEAFVHVVHPAAHVAHGQRLARRATAGSPQEEKRGALVLFSSPATCTSGPSITEPSPSQPIFFALLQTKGHPTPPQILLLHHPRHVRHQEKPRAQPEPAMLCLRARVAAQLPCPSPSSAPATPLARFARLSTVSLAVAPPASAPPPASKRASPPFFLSGARWGPPMRPSFSVGKSRPTTRGERSGESVSVTSFTEGFTHCRVLFHTHTHTGLEECCFLVS